MDDIVNEIASDMIQKSYTESSEADRDVFFIPVAYRWLAQFFLRPPSHDELKQYLSDEGEFFLGLCRQNPALSRSAEMLEKKLTEESDIKVIQSWFARAFFFTFDEGSSRIIPPYASFYLDERALLYQAPTREMNRLLASLQLALPDDIREPNDHISIQLHLVAELYERERLKHNLPISSTEFVENYILKWLPIFVERCQMLSQTNPYRILSQSVLDFAWTHMIQSSKQKEHVFEQKVM